MQRGEKDIVVPVATCCGKPMSKATDTTFACCECRAEIKVPTTTAYVECDWCKVYYHNSFIEEVGAADEVQMFCPSCRIKEFPDSAYAEYQQQDLK